MARGSIAMVAAAALGGCGRIGFDASTTSTYQLVIERATWDVANAACAANGAHLVTIADAAENARVFAFAATIPIDPTDFPSTNHWRIMWMGGQAGPTITDPTSWTWATGEPMSYQNWRAGEPSANEPCLAMLGAEGGLWDNRPCAGPFGYLCETD